MRTRLICAAGAAVLVWWGVAGRPAQAVIIHPEDDAVVGTTPRPPATVVGRWDNNASAVAVAPNHIITTRHQGGGVGSTVVFGGTSYVVAEQFNEPGGADLRVARITTPGGQPANLGAFVSVFTGPDVPPEAFTVGGFGRGRGANLFAPTGNRYGYTWANEGNTNLRFGRNTIDGTAVSEDNLTRLLVADFDGPNDPGNVDGEASFTEFDSGGGWFIQRNSAWVVTALNFGVENGQTQQAFYRDAATGTIPDPQQLAGVRLSQYAPFINNSIPEPSTAALLAPALLGLLARRRRLRQE